jgi:hypothetical protein
MRDMLTMRRDDWWSRLFVPSAASNTGISGDIRVWWSLTPDIVAKVDRERRAVTSGDGAAAWCE